MKKIRKKNPLREYLDRKGIRGLHFSKDIGMHSNTIYSYLSGDRWPSRHTALIFSIKTNGELTLKDFGYE